MSETISIVVNDNNAYGVRLTCFKDYLYHHSVAAQRIWDKEVVEEIVSHLVDGTDVLDIGANIGLVSLGVLQQARGRLRSIHCFECDTRTFQLLVSNLSPYSAVKMYPFALGDSQQLCNTAVNIYNQGCNRIYCTKDAIAGERSCSAPIDQEQLCLEHHVFILSIPLDSIRYQFTNRVSVVKIDVEGFELQVLRGATAFLRQHCPIIVIEIITSHFEEVRSFLAGIRYTTYRRILNPLYLNEDYVFFPDDAPALSQ